jgi:quercetin dioxygenase-like cupin family protein
VFKYVDMSEQGVRLMPAAELVETDWSLPHASEQGYMRTVCRGFIGSGASLGVGVMPIGQRSPLHTPNSEHLLLGLSGRLTWRVEGQDYVMSPMDLLFIGADREYEYWNSGFEEARFVDVIGRVGPWPHQTEYR